MRLVQLPAIAVSTFASHGVDMDFLPSVQGGTRTRTTIVRFTAGGVLGMHEATLRQVFAVLDGRAVVTSTTPPEGSTSDEPDVRVLKAGQAAIWDVGENHETRAVTDLLVAVLETDGELHFREHTDLPPYGRAQ
ncbi:hypothetical protein [Myceligenerans pegani]|uniref:Cupin domain-containing protein n=1 Tax=Myceligenerans pegani TaxID=2776917 RepID=A0ABR9MVT0_9MICO|nr:hypothetical protein [Myceligenerans sp. TRM 65318]MBE1875489.1 hypothetical protein [Myceligenerans sp. TRM 65318]MBE3017760.1 hypothetical protein [Myceligenerans sp. TRM 65318]